jgi:hypothetical protein
VGGGLGVRKLNAVAAGAPLTRIPGDRLVALIDVDEAVAVTEWLAAIAALATRLGLAGRAISKTHGACSPT